jgi:hypothetical protein
MTLGPKFGNVGPGIKAEPFPVVKIKRHFLKPISPQRCIHGWFAVILLSMPAEN